LRESGGGEAEDEDEGEERGHRAPDLSEMLPDFLAVVEVVICWVFCKKRGAARGFLCGKRGQNVVKSLVIFDGLCTVFGAIRRCSQD
jgi:hypothetical protein